MSDDEMDPEVRADLELRDSSMRDRTRSRGAGIYDWKPPVAVETWPCRRPNCDGEYPVDSDAVEYLAMFNGQLATRGEIPIARSEIGYCQACRDEYKRSAPDRRRGQVDRMREAIQKLKASPDPDNEHDLIRQIRDWHHPDVDGLLKTLRDKLKANKKSGRADL